LLDSTIVLGLGAFYWFPVPSDCLKRIERK